MSAHQEGDGRRSPGIKLQRRAPTHSLVGGCNRSSHAACLDVCLTGVCVCVCHVVTCPSCEVDEVRAGLCPPHANTRLSGCFRVSLLSHVCMCARSARNALRADACTQQASNWYVSRLAFRSPSLLQQLLRLEPLGLPASSIPSTVLSLPPFLLLSVARALRFGGCSCWQTDHDGEGANVASAPVAAGCEADSCR